MRFANATSVLCRPVPRPLMFVSRVTTTDLMEEMLVRVYVALGTTIGCKRLQKRREQNDPQMIAKFKTCDPVFVEMYRRK